MSHFQSNFMKWRDREREFEGNLQEGTFNGKIMVSFTSSHGPDNMKETPLCQASSRGFAAVPGSWVQQREKRDGAQHHLTLLSNLDSSEIIVM